MICSDKSTPLKQETMIQYIQLSRHTLLTRALLYDCKRLLYGCKSCCTCAVAVQFLLSAQVCFYCFYYGASRLQSNFKKLFYGCKSCRTWVITVQGSLLSTQLSFFYFLIVNIVARFGDISPLWQNFKIFCHFLKCLLSNCQNFNLL